MQQLKVFSWEWASRGPSAMAELFERIVTAWLPSVCLFLCPVFPNPNRARGAYSTWLVMWQHATRPAYTSGRQYVGPTYLFIDLKQTANHASVRRGWINSTAIDVVVAWYPAWFVALSRMNAYPASAAAANINANTAYYVSAEAPIFRTRRFASV